LDDLFKNTAVKKCRSSIFEAFIDGASSGNPGPAGAGVVISKGKHTVRNLSKFIGTATNNVAEYMALIFALQELLSLKARSIVINTDSQLLANQIKKKFKVKNDTLKILYLKAQRLCSEFDEVKINDIPREQNREADKLAVKAIREQAKMVAPAEQAGEESPSSRGKRKR